MKAGAVEFIDQAYRKKDLVEGDPRIDRARSGPARKEDSKPGRCARDTSSSRRAGEVMALVLAGQLNKQIAGELATAEPNDQFMCAHHAEDGAESLAELVNWLTARHAKG